MTVATHSLTRRAAWRRSARRRRNQRRRRPLARRHVARRRSRLTPLHGRRPLKDVDDCVIRAGGVRRAICVSDRCSTRRFRSTTEGVGGTGVRASSFLAPRGEGAAKRRSGYIPRLVGGEMLPCSVSGPRRRPRYLQNAFLLSFPRHVFCGALLTTVGVAVGLGATYAPGRL
jgi:hypothetical protein